MSFESLHPGLAIKKNTAPYYEATISPSSYADYSHNLNTRFVGYVGTAAQLDGYGGETFNFPVNAVGGGTGQVSDMSFLYIDDDTVRIKNNSGTLSYKVRVMAYT